MGARPQPSLTTRSAERPSNPSSPPLAGSLSRPLNDTPQLFMLRTRADA